MASKIDYDAFSFYEDCHRCHTTNDYGTGKFNCSECMAKYEIREDENFTYNRNVLGQEIVISSDCEMTEDDILQAAEMTLQNQTKRGE